MPEIFLNGERRKVACGPCIRGHRSSRCNHKDRVMIEVRKPGRPLSACPLITGLCTCDRLIISYTIPKSSECPCPSKRHGGLTPSTTTGGGNNYSGSVTRSDTSSTMTVTNSKTNSTTTSISTPLTATSTSTLNPTSLTTSSGPLMSRYSKSRYSKYSILGKNSSRASRTGIGPSVYSQSHPTPLPALATSASVTASSNISSFPCDIKLENGGSAESVGTASSGGCAKVGGSCNLLDSKAVVIGSMSGDVSIQIPTTAMPIQTATPNPVQAQTLSHPQSHTNTLLQPLSPSLSPAPPKSSTPSPDSTNLCHCGDTCQCLGCLSHPRNKTTMDYVRYHSKLVLKPSSDLPASPLFQANVQPHDISSLNLLSNLTNNTDSLHLPPVATSNLMTTRDLDFSLPSDLPNLHEMVDQWPPFNNPPPVTHSSSGTVNNINNDYPFTIYDVSAHVEGEPCFTMNGPEDALFSALMNNPDEQSHICWPDSASLSSPYSLFNIPSRTSTATVSASVTTTAPLPSASTTTTCATSTTTPVHPGTSLYSAPNFPESTSPICTLHTPVSFSTANETAAAAAWSLGVQTLDGSYDAYDFSESPPTLSSSTSSSTSTASLNDNSPPSSKSVLTLPGQTAVNTLTLSPNNFILEQIVMPYTCNSGGGAAIQGIDDCLNTLDKHPCHTCAPDTPVNISLPPPQQQLLDKSNANPISTSLSVDHTYTFPACTGMPS